MESVGIFAPYIPLIDKATDLIIKIVKIYETAEYNKNICEALVNRVKLTENAIDTLQRRKQKNVDIFNDEVYYKAFNRFIYVLEEIEKFAAEISNIRGLKKYTQADFVKNKFQKLTNDYDVAMKDLHFTMAVASEEQRKIEEEALKDDLDEMSNYIKKMHNDILENNNEVNNKIDFIYDAVKHMRNHSDVSYNVNKIDSKDLISVKSTDKRGCDPNFIIKKTYKGLEVACKYISNDEEKMKTCSRTQKIHEILMKSSECKHILKFYGMSTIENRNVMVFEWAERGSLRQLYEQKDIPFHYKIRIALEICRGLIFLQCAGILHHDLGCNNILMTETLEPKIYNFELAHKIKKHVIKGHRERITFEISTPENQKIKKIINDTWKQNPQERISFMKLLDMLEELHNSIRMNPTDILRDKSLDSSKYISNADADLELPDEVISPVIFKPVISLEEGIKAFKAEKHQKAWECFDFHAKNNNTTAKYWKGRYLWEGYLDGIKEREEGKELFKEAADEGNSDAQLRYAFTLLNKLEEENNRQIFLEYLKKAAGEGNNPTAQFNLGDIYYKGKCNIPKDEYEGIRWLMKAALQDNEKATNLLNQLNIDVYDIEYS
ncbi:5704_t:CDS:2 [Rhizophagus irregularis]|nr:5704_t:CDS:2 [Rhizophagus irregularis]